MRIEELLSILEGNYGKQAFIKLTDGTEISPICYGTNANDYGDTFLVVSEGKSRREILTSQIKDIYFL